MGGLLALSRGIDRVSTFIGRSVAWLILLAIFVSAINAIVRKAFNTSSNAYLELQWYLFGAAFMLASAWALLENEHVRIDLLYGRWSRRTQHWIDLLGTLFFLMPFTLVMIGLIYPSMMSSWRTHEISMNAGGLIIWPAKAVLLAGFALLFVQGISEAIKKVAVMQGLIPDTQVVLSAQEAAMREAEELLATMEADAQDYPSETHPAQNKNREDNT